MTSLCTILGLSTAGHGPGAGRPDHNSRWQVAVVGGLITNMLLTRLLIPIGYLAFEKIRADRQVLRDSVRIWTSIRDGRGCVTRRGRFLSPPFRGRKRGEQSHRIYRTRSGIAMLSIPGCPRPRSRPGLSPVRQLPPETPRALATWGRSCRRSTGGDLAQTLATASSRGLRAPPRYRDFVTRSSQPRRRWAPPPSPAGRPLSPACVIDQDFAHRPRGRR